MKKLLLATALVACSPLSAQASAYLGGTIGISQFEYDDIDNATGHSILAGYQFSESNWYLEGALVDTGEADVTSLSGVTFGVDGYTLSAGYYATLDPRSGSGFYMRGGFYSTDATARGPGGSATDSGSGVALGLGGDWMLAPSFGLRCNLEGLLGVADFADNKNITLFTVGIVYRFAGIGAKP